MQDIQRLNQPKTAFFTKGILTEAETVSFLHLAKDQENLLAQPTSLLVKHGLAYLHQNYTRPISRKDVADAVGVTENYLSQIFRQEITISPWDYLTRLRIQKACDLLQSTPDSITAISYQVGFNDSAYFSRVFRKITGRPPQEYRRLVLQAR